MKIIMATQVKTMEENQVIRNAKCEDCGCNIPIAVTRKGGKIVCQKCWNYPQPPSISVSVGIDFNDDLQASASWDMIVARWEDSIC